MPRKTPSAKWLGCLGLIFLPFALLAAAPVYFFGATFWKWHEARRWVPTPSTIIETDLRVARAVRRGPLYSDVTGSYEYEYRGQKHRSSSILLYSGKTGSFDRDLHEELSRRVASGESYIVYVNPRNPAEAVLNRDLRVDDVLGFSVAALFGGCVLFGIMGTVIAGGVRIRSQNTRARLVDIHPGQPWFHREDWANLTIRVNRALTLAVASVLAVVTTGVALPLLFFLPPEILNNDNQLAIVGLLSLLTAAFMIGWAVIAFRRWQRFRHTVFQMLSLPAYLGDRLTGTIHTPALFPMRPDSIKLTLRCEKTVILSHGGKSRSETADLWSGEGRATPVASMSSGMEIPVDFPLPLDQPPTDEIASDKVRWHLHAEAQLPGADFDVRFQVPVFARS